MSRKTVYNNFVTTEMWDKVNEDNKELMDEFLGYLASIQRSKETIHQYHNDLKIAFVWMLKNCKNKHFTEIKKRDVIKYQGYLLNTCKMSGARIRRMRSTLSSLSNFIESIMDEDYPNFRNIINKIEAPVLQPVREKTILTFEQCEEVANKLIEDNNPQLACLLMVACYSGLRKQELTRLLYKDFTTEKNLALGDNFYKTSPIKVKGRGNRMENKYIWNRVDKYLSIWIAYREEHNVECEYLFFRGDNENPKKLLVATMNSFANTLERYFKEPIYWHSFRHTLATELTRSGLPIDIVQFLLSHSSSETSKLYIDTTDDENMEKFADFFSGKIEKYETKDLSNL